MKYQPVIFTVNYVFLLFPMHCYHSNIFFEGEMKIHSGLVSMYQKIDKLYNKHMLACSNDSQRACIYNVTAETLNPSSYSPCNVPTSDKVRTTVRTAVKRQKCETLVQVDQRCLQRTNICFVTLIFCRRMRRSSNQHEMSPQSVFAQSSIKFNFPPLCD